MNASRDARAADISELLPWLPADELDDAVQLWCDWFGGTNSPLDASAGDWATFVARVDRGGMSSNSARV